MKKPKPTKAQILRLRPKSILVFLLNRERVLGEMVELIRLHIAKLLDVDPKAVSATLELAPGGRILPTFNVEAPQAGAWEQQYIQKGIAEVWLGWAKQELVDRLRGLSEVRQHGPQENSPHPSPETPEESSEEETPSGGDPV